MQDFKIFSTSFPNEIYIYNNLCLTGLNQQYLSKNCRCLPIYRNTVFIATQSTVYIQTV